MSPSSLTATDWDTSVAKTLWSGHGDKIKHALKVLIAASIAESKHIGSRTWGNADDRVKATNFALLAVVGLYKADPWFDGLY